MECSGISQAGNTPAVSDEPKMLAQTGVWNSWQRQCSGFGLQAVSFSSGLCDVFMAILEMDFMESLHDWKLSSPFPLTCWS